MIREGTDDMAAHSINRTMSAEFLNRVANNEAVRPGLAGEGPLDLTDLVASPYNFALVCHRGGFVLTPLAPGVYEVHSLFLPDSGTVPIRAMREAQEWMFTRTDCVSICSKVPVTNRAAKGLAIAGGLAPVFTSVHPYAGETEFVDLPLMKWAVSAHSLEAHGRRFHDLVNATGAEIPEHNEDPIHERAVGAALLMFERGQPDKAAAFYNQWAAWAGYSTVNLISRTPVAVDVSDGFILGLGAQGMEILRCP